MNSTNEISNFRNRLAANGIIGYSFQQLDYLLNVAKICMRTNGVPVAGATAVMSAGVGAVTLPVIGSVPGLVAGALVGFASGTVTCTIAHASLKKELDKLVSGLPY